MIASAASRESARLDAAKVGLLAGSAIAVIVGVAALAWTIRSRHHDPLIGR